MEVVGNVTNVREMLKVCIAGLSEYIAADDVVNIGNSIAYELDEYDSYSEKVSAILESKMEHPLNVASQACLEVESFIEESSGDELALSLIPTLSAVIRDAAISTLAVPYACSVIDIIDDDDEECAMATVSAFVDMYEMTYGAAMLCEISFDKEMRALIEIASSGFDIDMMGDDVEEIPQSFDRGEIKEVGSHEYGGVVGADMSLAKSILGRLSLKTEDYDSLIEKAAETDEDGLPKYSTTELVRKAQEIVGEYE